MRKFFISDQVEILLQRMDDYPEQFFTSSSFSSRIGVLKSWSAIVERGHFNLVESFLIRKKLRSIRRRQTQNDIIECLVDGPTDLEVTGSLYPTITIPSAHQTTLNVSDEIKIK